MCAHMYAHTYIHMYICTYALVPSTLRMRRVVQQAIQIYERHCCHTYTHVAWC